ncbi:hypothetical protein HK100_002999 [Physocladia obscura]|uniref:Alternative oxidase n=1 Tax=Physocladia obscura TaxID=109957 RepID=A0AAD5SUN4_9FUNG|nr:hypothetical protein HK100_002999 [Physocladia obscura]
MLSQLVFYRKPFYLAPAVLRNLCIIRRLPSSLSGFAGRFSSTGSHFNASSATAGTQVTLHPKTVFDLELKNHDHLLYHPVYNKEEIDETKYTHRETQGIRDQIAFSAIRLMHFGFDYATGYVDKIGVMTETQWLNRIIFLETVAGVPGMVAGMARHMRSLRTLGRDNGWINTLLQEAENERMHLLTFMKLKNPDLLFRIFVLFAQGIFFNAYFFAYLLSPKTCHRFVGYLEESAVHTYTLCLKDIEGGGKIAHWGSHAAPEIAKFYWRLGDRATVKDVVAVVRADEANHRDTNHVLASLDASDKNPLA